MSEQENSGKWPSPDPDLILASLLDRLDAAMDHVRSTAAARPLFSVEAELTATLREMIPEAKFTATDIRDWSAQISS